MIIRFKTSRTFLETLFPTAQFRFKVADTVAMASFVATRAHNTRHTTLRFYVHGVQYIKKDGIAIDGTYMPVVFETPSSPGTSEAGLLPTVLCDIELSTGNTSVRTTASWRGAKFADITVDDLQDEEQTEKKQEEDERCREESTDEEGILFYRYIPAIHTPGKPAAEYPCLIPRPPCTEEERRKSTKMAKMTRPESGSVKTAVTINIVSHDWETLPTLHHIASTLAEVPIYEIVSAKVVELVGTARADDGTSCIRLE